MDEEQRFAFDTWGFLTIEEAITEAQVAELKGAADEKGAMLYSQLEKDGGFWSQAYVDLLDLPAISAILDEIFGGARPGGLPAFRIDHINVHTHGVFNENLAGGRIHGGNGRLLHPARPPELVPIYFDRNAANDTYANGLVTVAFELEDTVCNGGGFGCLAGSHKGHLPVPETWLDLSAGVHPMITRVPARAGSAIIFTEALSHVTLPWTAPSTRTTLFYKFTEHGEAYSGEDQFFQPSGAAQWQGVDERKRTILTPPPQAYVHRRRKLARQEAEKK